MHCQGRLDPTIRAGNSLSRSDAPGPCTAEYQMTALRREFWRRNGDVRSDSPSYQVPDRGETFAQPSFPPPSGNLWAGVDDWKARQDFPIWFHARSYAMVSSGSGTRVVGWRGRQRRTISGTTVYPSGSRDVVQDSLYGKETAQAKIHRPAADRSPKYQWTLPRALQMLMRCAHGASCDLSPLRLNALVKGVRPRG